VRPTPPVVVSVKDRSATLCVDAANCRLEDLVAVAEDLGYAATVKSITPHAADEVSSAEPPD
jgi:hypothetical protein